MKYKEKVKEKIKESDIRTKERLKIWDKICEDYEKGGPEQVKSDIYEFADSIKYYSDKIISKLNEML